jgi:hypothetical protein
MSSLRRRGRRFALTLFGPFALMALVLAAAGIYGVLAGGQSRKSVALGGRTAGNILKLVVAGMT